jgi:hypothetical protein
VQAADVPVLAGPGAVEGLCPASPTRAKAKEITGEEDPTGVEARTGDQVPENGRDEKPPTAARASITPVAISRMPTTRPAGTAAPEALAAVLA